MEAASPTPDPVTKSNKTVLIVLGSILLVVVLGLAVFFATRSSAEEKALQAACTARADIADRVESLASTSITNFTVNGVKNDVTAIYSDLKTIQANESKLHKNRRQEFKQANQEFATAIKSTLSDLGTNLSIDNAADKLATAGKELISSYKETLEPVDCSGVKLDR
jgi:flagellar basal body-associated protein FliL